jgi:ankyrin repeat protein
MMDPYWTSRKNTLEVRTNKAIEYEYSLRFSFLINSQNGLTPLHLAVQGNHSKTIASLIDFGAPLNAVAVVGDCRRILLISRSGHLPILFNNIF